MNRQDAEKIVTEYLKPIFGFALKRCKSAEDAEDLSQEIALKVFRALLVREDIVDVGKFVWTAAHNALSNYYRDAARGTVGVPIDEAAELIADPAAEFGGEEEDESLRRLQSEIGYLSGKQRRIVIAFYFENRNQKDIADSMGIPLGTVKWHLFEARKELRRGMSTLRKASELKFHPIQFHSYGINGTIGTKTPDIFFRSALAQNICYCVRNTAKTVNEIADDLGVSPVYVEGEAAFLEEYGFLQLQKDRYLVNFIISEPDAELLTMQNDMYRQAAGMFAGDLYAELTESGILEDPGIVCGQTDGPVTVKEEKRPDRNFVLWALIPYIAAWSGEKLRDDNISFEEVATIRPDGANNIFHATVLPEYMTLPEDYVYMRNWYGPMWNADGKNIFWQIDSEWSERVNEVHDRRYMECSKRILALYAQEGEDMLSEEDYAWLTQQGYVKTNGGGDGIFKSAWQIVILENSDIKNRLLAIGDRIREKYREEFERLKAPYVQAVLKSVPKHLEKMKAFELQYLFQSDGWFLCHCITALLKDGRLNLPTQEQRKSMSTLIFPE